jgi:hypothetical protein
MSRAALLLWLAAGTAWAIPEGPEPNTPEWFAREAQNYARTLEAPAEQALNPAFLQRLEQQSLANQTGYNARLTGDPSWFAFPSGNTPLTPLCSTWMEQCAGDPFRYAGVAGADGAAFYDGEAEVVPFVIYDDGCARLSGRVWSPRGAARGLPGVVIENGSIQAPEPIYWWFAQALVRAGYVVLTFDPRGQGRSDQQTPDGVQGSNANASVFWTGLVNVIDFFRSTPVQPYPHNAACAGTYPTEVTGFNPFHDRIDRERLGLAGHSLGATGVSTVQAYGAPGADPWPGLIDTQNPVKVIVAWDSLNAAFKPRVPAMGQSSEYGIFGSAFLAPPDPESNKAAFAAWSAAGVPVFEMTIAGSTHFEWSLIPTFPATSWCADTTGNVCRGGWGNPMAQHYSVAWLDRWLKKAGEPGFADADQRLLADGDWCERYSFYFRSARDFSDRAGMRHSSADIRADCLAAGQAAAAPRPRRFGGLAGLGLLLPLLLLGCGRRRRALPF